MERFGKRKESKWALLQGQGVFASYFGCYICFDDAIIFILCAR
jgi:hypothetical protein